MDWKKRCKVDQTWKYWILAGDEILFFMDQLLSVSQVNTIF